MANRRLGLTEARYRTNPRAHAAPCAIGACGIHREERRLRTASEVKDCVGGYCAFSAQCLRSLQPVVDYIEGM